MKPPFIFLILISAAAVLASAPSARSAPSASGDRAENYQLAVRDLIRFSVLGEAETLVEQRIDGDGRIRVPYVGEFAVAGRTVREAEKLIEAAYVESAIYIAPQANLRVIEYSVKEASVLGQVKTPGRIAFPIELNSLDILDVISQAGGFTGIARSREVRVTRAGSEGREQVFTINVDRMLTGRGGESEPAQNFRVLPGDVIFVPERFF